jgi:hypothetical protein
LHYSPHWALGLLGALHGRSHRLYREDACSMVMAMVQVSCVVACFCLPLVRMSRDLEVPLPCPVVLCGALRLHCSRYMYRVGHVEDVIAVAICTRLGGHVGYWKLEIGAGPCM